MRISDWSSDVCSSDLTGIAVSVKVSIAPHQSIAPENPPLPETGTAPAINYLTSGVAGLSASGTGRGCARNRADRESHALTAAQIGNLKDAERHAEKIGLPFTRKLSIHLQAQVGPLAVLAKATGRFTATRTKGVA